MLCLRAEEGLGFVHAHAPVTVSVRQAQDHRREPVSPQVARLPDDRELRGGVRAALGRQRIEQGVALQRAADVAAAVRAHERQRPALARGSRHHAIAEPRPHIHAGHVFQALEREARHEVAHTAQVHSDGPARPPRRTNELQAEPQVACLHGRQEGAHGVGQLARQDLAGPAPAHLHQQESRRLGRGAQHRLALLGAHQRAARAAHFSAGMGSGRAISSAAASVRPCRPAAILAFQASCCAEYPASKRSI